MKRLKILLLRLTSLFLLAYLCLIAVLFVMQRHLIYFPHDAVSGEERARLAGYRRIEAPSSDGLTLHAYFLPPRGKNPIVIFFHGNASHPAWTSYKTEKLRESGYGVLLASYRGYSGNPGYPDEQGLYADARAQLGWLDAQADWADNPRVYYGESLGSGVAVELALDKAPAALILEVPFYSLLETVERKIPYIPLLRLLLRDHYRSDLKIGRIGAPILFLLAGQDRVVGFEGGLKLSTLATMPKRVEIFPAGDHNTLYQFDAERRVMTFLKEMFP